MLKPVQRGLSRQDSAIGAARFRLARNKAEHGIVAQLIVIVQVFIAKRKAVDTLGEERLDAVLDPVLPAAICKAGRRLPGVSEMRWMRLCRLDRVRLRQRRLASLAGRCSRAAGRRSC